MSKNQNTTSPHEMAARHKVHQEMLEWHRYLKQERANRHKKLKSYRSVIPILLV